MTVGSLFSGIGGMDLGLERAGMQVRWQVEIDPFCQRVLAKHWPGVKRYGDITKLDGAELEPVDLVCGGFPCQPVSLAGRRKAQSDDRWLWPDFIRIVRVVRPRFVFVENTPGLASAGVEEDEDGEWIEARGLALGEVLGDLAASGYDAEWDRIPASAFGANHLRYRVWIVAYPAEHGRGEGRARRSDSGGTRQREQPLSDAYADDAGRGDGRCEQPGTAPGGGPVGGTARHAVLPRPRIFADSDITGLQERQEQDMLAQLAAAKRTAPNAYRIRCEANGQAGIRSDGFMDAGRDSGQQIPQTADSVADYDGELLVGAAIARGERHAWTAERSMVRALHGFASWLDGFDMSHSHVLLCEHGNANKANTGEVLRVLWRKVRAEAFERWQTGGPCGLYAEKPLLAYLRKLAQVSAASEHLHVESEKVQEASVRSVRRDESADLSPRRSKLPKQLRREPTDPLQVLSRLLALHAEKAWAEYRWQNAPTVLSNWGPTWDWGIRPMAHSIPNRVDRIRSLGNAVVPQVAEWIGRRIISVASGAEVR